MGIDPACDVGPPRLLMAAQLGESVRHDFDDRRGSGGVNLPRLARSTDGWQLRIQLQLGQDLLDHRLLKSCRDDLQFAAAAVAARAALRVKFKDALEQPRPADAVRPGLHRLDLARGCRCGFAGRLLRLWPHQWLELCVQGHYSVVREAGAAYFAQRSHADTKLIRCNLGRGIGARRAPFGRDAV